MKERTFRLLLAAVQSLSARDLLTPKQVAKDAAAIALSFADLEELTYLARHEHGIVCEVARSEWWARYCAENASEERELRSGDGGQREAEGPVGRVVAGSAADGEA